MAKLTVTFENNEIKKELQFRGNLFAYTMKEVEGGKSGDAKCFEDQIQDTFGEEYEELLEAAERLDFGDEDEIEAALEVLTEFE